MTLYVNRLGCIDTRLERGKSVTSAGNVRSPVCAAGVFGSLFLSVTVTQSPTFARIARGSVFMAPVRTLVTSSLRTNIVPYGSWSPDFALYTMSLAMADTLTATALDPVGHGVTEPVSYTHLRAHETDSYL